MGIEIKILNGEIEEEYSRFVRSIDHSLVYYSLPYRKFLRDILVDSVDLYFVAYRGDDILGVLPSFLKLNKVHGNILNSLPFFGSNGGVLVDQDNLYHREVQKNILKRFYEYAADNSAVSCTIISNPFDTSVTLYQKNTSFTFRDERVGQFTPLPMEFRNRDDLKSQLMSQFHSKTRNAIRKAQKSNIVVRDTFSYGRLKRLYELHQENMKAIGGMIKPWSIFASIEENFIYDTEYRLYTAEKDDKAISALLVLLFNKTAEYFIPASKEEYRTFQPMSLLCFQAMEDAAINGCRWWNWGGTWLSQTGVYNFKKRWGTQDKPYYYYVTVLDSALLKSSKELLLKNYPFFYVRPFEKLCQD